MRKRSPLQRFIAANPWSDLVIMAAPDPFKRAGDSLTGPSNIMHHGRVIAHYTRRRDAERAMAACGCVREGIFWRHVPVHEREHA
jgi:hypothetical protein